MQSHSKHIVLASMLYGDEFKIKDFEVIKRIRNPVQGRAWRNDEELVVPIVENTCFEIDLADRYVFHSSRAASGTGEIAELRFVNAMSPFYSRMLEAMRAYPASNAVIVRRHGIYVWGDTWQECKTM